MSPRSIRRAAERHQQKLARKAARQVETHQIADTQLSEELDFTPEPCISPTQFAVVGQFEQSDTSAADIASIEDLTRAATRIWVWEHLVMN